MTDKIAQGLQEAIAYAKGDKTAARETTMPPTGQFDALVAELRGWADNTGKDSGPFAHAADAIEALQRERDEWQSAAATAKANEIEAESAKVAAEAQVAALREALKAVAHDYETQIDLKHETYVLASNLLKATP